jgi:predicted site-specific integrase-resolvase
VGQTPQTTRRVTPVVGYARCETVNDPDLAVQIKAIRDWAGDHGYELTTVVAEIAPPTMTCKPKLEGIIRDLDEGRYAGVIVHTRLVLGPERIAKSYIRRIHATTAWFSTTTGQI